jgi:prepilin peptidase CpaA
MLAGLIVHFAQNGWTGAMHSLFGSAIGFGVFLIFYLLGGMGGGDVKLMAGFGALLGAKRLFEAALWTAGCGGVMALAVIATGLIRDFWVQSKWARGTAGSEPAAASEKQDQRRDSIPYAPAIAAGVWLSLVGAT